MTVSPSMIVMSSPLNGAGATKAMFSISTVTPTGAVPIALNVWAASPLAVALAELAPGVGPSVRIVEARPSASVVVLVIESVPPPAVTCQSTGRFGTGPPSPAVTRSTKGAASGWDMRAICWGLSPDSFVAAAATTPRIVKVAGARAVPSTVAETVLSPAPEPAVSVTEASPLLFVVVEAFETDPPPAVTDQLTRAFGTLRFCESLTRTVSAASAWRPTATR